MRQRGLHVVCLDLVPHEPPMLRRVPHESRHRKAERHLRQPVEDARDPLSIAFVNKLGHELRRKRQEADEQKHQEVQSVERRVSRAQCPRDRRVLQPDDADREEARDVREVRRPLVQDGPQHVVGGVGRDPELEHECDCDREDAVAERLQAAEGQLVR